MGRVGTYGEEVDGRGDVVLVVLNWLLPTLSNSLVSSNMDDTVNAFLVGVRGEHLVDIRLEGNVTLEEINHAVVFVCLGGSGGQGLEGELGHALEGLGERVGEAATETLGQHLVQRFRQGSLRAQWG